MAAPISASTLVKILRAEGCKVEEYRSWRTHNRNHVGAWGSINGVMIHHTVTSSTSGSVSMCYNGYSGLPGPLCHGVIAKSGTIYLVGNGRANHAGGGDPTVLNQVINESYGTRPSGPNRGNSNGVDGNARFYGFECVNLGNGRDPWPAEQLDAIERASAAICRYYGWSAKSVIGHLEWSSDKIDPRGFTMSSMRSRIQDRLGSAPDSEENDVQLSDKLAIGQWLQNRFPDEAGLQDGEISVKTALASGYGWSRIAADNSLRIMAKLDAQAVTIDKLVDAVGSAGSFDPEELKQEIREAIESVRVQLVTNTEE